MCSRQEVNSYQVCQFDSVPHTHVTMTLSHVHLDNSAKQTNPVLARMRFLKNSKKSNFSIEIIIILWISPSEDKRMGNCNQAEKNQLEFFNSNLSGSGLGNAAQTTKLQNCQGLCFRNSSYLPVNKGKTMNSPNHNLPDQNQEAKGSFSCASTCKWVHWPNNTMVADHQAIGNVAFQIDDVSTVVLIITIILMIMMVSTKFTPM